ncbi:hypothetical protein H6P81_015675 [Aristolochia fimbriata]|uniref:Uncharacterized protein n=1 Tax=Aristolochia fimbriata TaxID=158543 RepID=A0AAV7E665_ARIFI|nr:hypothetical protein H6P81_015675 [Aristolochia fimbriata]
MVGSGWAGSEPSVSLEVDQELLPARSPIKRPDARGRVGKNEKLLVNHFQVKFHKNLVLEVYSTDVECLEKLPHRVSKSERILEKNKYFMRESPVGVYCSVFDGYRLYSVANILEGVFTFTVEEDDQSTYVFNVRKVKSLELRGFHDYLNNFCSVCPKELLQAVNAIFRENLTRIRTQLGEYFYPKNVAKDFLGECIVALRGIKQSLKPTIQGLVKFYKNLVLEVYSIDVECLKKLPHKVSKSERILQKNKYFMREFPGGILLCLRWLQAIECC